MEMFMLGFYITLGVIAAIGAIGAGLVVVALITATLASIFKWLLPRSKGGGGNGRFSHQD